MSQRTLTLLGDVVRCNFVITYVLAILGHERRPSERRGRHVTRLLSTCVPPLDGSKNLRAASISARKCIYKQYNQLEGLTFRAQSEARPASPLTHHRKLVEGRKWDLLQQSSKTRTKERSPSLWNRPPRTPESEGHNGPGMETQNFETSCALRACSFAVAVMPWPLRY